MGSNLQATVGDVLQIVSDLRGESSTNSDATRIRAVSRANQDFARRMFWRFYRLNNQTIVGTAANDYTIGGSAVATYPMRMKGLSEVFVAKTADTYKTYNSERCAIVDYNTYKNLFNQNNSAPIVYEWFDAANDIWKMHINPAPATTDTVTYSYYWEPPTKTLTTDKVICPNVIILALLALGEIYKSEDERDLSLEVKNEAEQLISECVGKENSPAVNQTYSMGAVENATQPKGIGSC